MSRSDLTFPAVVSLCRLERDAMDGFVLKDGLHVTSPISVVWLHTINFGEECHINLQHGDLPCLFGPGLECWASDERQRVPFYGFMNRVCAVLDQCVVVLVVLISAHRFHCAS